MVSPRVNIQYMRLLVPAKNRKDRPLQKRAASQFPISNSVDLRYICIPEVPKPAGYMSACFSKWHLSDDTQGFDISSANRKEDPGGSFYGHIDATEQLTDGALGFIEDRKKGPFFL